MGFAADKRLGHDACNQALHVETAVHPSTGSLMRAMHHLRSVAALVTLSFGLGLAGCGGGSTGELTAPPISNCPAASVLSASSGGAAAGLTGCDHRASVDIPLARVIDLNDNAQVLGDLNASGSSAPAVWSKTGTRPLSPPAGALSVTATDLNDAGVVVGCARYPNDVTASLAPRDVAPTGVCHVVRWDAAGVPTDLGLIDPAAMEARALAVNNAGAIVGAVTYASGTQRAFVRSASGEVTLLPTAGTSNTAVALDETGEVTGWYTSGSPRTGPFRAFVWTQAGGVVDLGTVPSRIAGTEASLVPLAINESGDIVGTVYGYSASSPDQPARSSVFLYTRAGGIRDIGAASGLDAAVSINDQGEILGWAMLDGIRQPVTWATSRPNDLAVRYGWTPAGAGDGTVYQVNNWNEALDSFTQAGTVRNLVWSWNPERYR
jgi:uncharacterized membrane protein